MNCFSLEQVVRLDERDRYKQLLAQYTTLQTPDYTGRILNSTAEEPLRVQTDLLTKTRTHPRSACILFQSVSMLACLLLYFIS